MRHYSKLLNLLFFLFFLRVLGQVVVALWAPAWLPPMEHWYSGLIPYSILLPIQILIIALMIWINYRVSNGRAFFENYAGGIGSGLQWFSYVYFGGMATRYVVTMWMFPKRRWLGEGTIPIVFHFVLAGYLFVLGDFYVRELSSGET